MNRLSNEEYFEILSELDSRHGVFYHLWDMGSPIFSDNIGKLAVPTAGVILDKDGECINFLLNKDFWNSISFEEKLFILCHECLHVVLNHGHRLFRNAKSKEDFMIMNYATDVVINHTLVNKFGFDRSVIDPHNAYCWTDTVFPKETDVPEDKSSEFYYNKIYDYVEEQGKMPSDGEGDGSGPQTVDEHSTFMQGDDGNNKDMSDILRELEERLTDDEKNFIQDLINSNKDLDEKINPSENSEDAGTSPGNIFKRVELKKVKKKKKWETVIKKWANKYLKNTDTEELQWARTNRRFQMLTDSEMFLPSEMELEDIAIEEKRIEVWFFQDTSGSCSGYTQRFFDAARSLPPDRFDIKMHCFDTRVYETDIDSGELYGFGGTSFNIIEQYIQQDIKKRNVPYPKAVFIITDGYGNNVSPEKPETWYWFLTPGGSKSYINKKSHVFNLKDFE
jgi:predicted metal-dependent peptidase